MDTETKKNIDVMSFLSGSSYPKSSVTIYLDAENADKLMKLNAAIENGSISGKEGDKQREVLINKIKSSAMVFHLQGMNPKDVREITNKLEDVKDENGKVIGDNGAEITAELLLRTLERVEDFEGNTIGPWDENSLQAFRDRVKEGEYARLNEAVMEVNFNAAIFDEAVDAGFLSRGDNLAG